MDRQCYFKLFNEYDLNNSQHFVKIILKVILDCCINQFHHPSRTLKKLCIFCKQQLKFNKSSRTMKSLLILTQKSSRIIFRQFLISRPCLNPIPTSRCIHLGVFLNDDKTKPPIDSQEAFEKYKLAAGDEKAPHFRSTIEAKEKTKDNKDVKTGQLLSVAEEQNTQVRYSKGTCQLKFCGPYLIS